MYYRGHAGTGGARIHGENDVIDQPQDVTCQSQTIVVKSEAATVEYNVIGHGTIV